MARLFACTHISFCRGHLCVEKTRVFELFTSDSIFRSNCLHTFTMRVKPVNMRSTICDSCHSIFDRDSSLIPTIALNMCLNSDFNALLFSNFLRKMEPPSRPETHNSVENYIVMYTSLIIVQYVHTLHAQPSAFLSLYCLAHKRSVKVLSSSAETNGTCKMCGRFPVRPKYHVQHCQCGEEARLRGGRA